MLYASRLGSLTEWIGLVGAYGRSVFARGLTCLGSTTSQHTLGSVVAGFLDIKIFSDVQ